LADGDTFGALSLYSRRASFFNSDVLPEGQAFAQHAAIAIAIAGERAQLLNAVEARGLVGQAQGILMERYNIRAEKAHTVLQRYAVHLDQRLRDIAEGVIRDRGLPEVDAVEANPNLHKPSAGQTSPSPDPTAATRPAESLRS
jgi:hypothetical protein